MKDGRFEVGQVFMGVAVAEHTIGICSTGICTILGCEVVGLEAQWDGSAVATLVLDQLTVTQTRELHARGRSR